ncbi:MAG: hypothetical protein RSE10_08005, partial [Oscillospiraceae bacterium]
NTYAGDETTEHYAIMGQMQHGEYGNADTTCLVIAVKISGQFWDNIDDHNTGYLSDVGHFLTPPAQGLCKII